MELKLIDVKHRQCYANNKKALFHKWIDIDEVLVKINGCVSSDDLRKINEIIDTIITNNVYSSNFNTEVIKRTYAIVEYEDGTIDYVDPKSIRFIDGKSYFDDYCWD